MSRKDVEVVRHPIAVAGRLRRRLEEQLVRFPRAMAFAAGAVWGLYVRLPARSRLRQAIARHYTQAAFGALNRGDLDVTFSLYHPAGESTWDAELVALGFDPVISGRQARLDAQRRWEREWGDIRIEPEELIDLGDSRLVIPVWVKGSGLSSGAPVDMNGAFIFTVSGGRVIHEQVFRHRADALEAAGLQE